jgi:hypothetical protein
MSDERILAPSVDDHAGCVDVPDRLTRAVRAQQLRRHRPDPGLGEPGARCYQKARLQEAIRVQQ